MNLREEMLSLIAEIQAHRDAGGSPFECPSMSAPEHIKAELQRGTSEVFKQEMKRHKL